MNEHEMERLAQRLGKRAAERLDVEATARAVLARLREQPARRIGWTPPEWLRVAAVVALLLGVGVTLDRVLTPGPSATASYGLEDLQELTTAELEQVLATLDRTLSVDEVDVPDGNLDGLTPEQLQSLLRSLET